MPFAVQAVPFLVGLGVLAAPLVWAFGPWGAFPPIVLALFVLFFFRDPERRPPAEEGLVLSPADGRVTSVERDAQGACVSIFLSIFDCHINRAPVAGVVASARHTPGRFRPAYDPRAGSENERNELTIRSERGVYGVTQVAGILARRIVCTKKAGDSVARGERIGLIRFGSRTDLRLPPGVDPLVAAGDRVRGGFTIVAREVIEAARAAGEARR
jgi:phosphatidylserine decarboxylase